MKPLFVILAQSNTGAVIFIIVLLLVAVIIGYFTAWFYAKSVYTPVIKGLESEKADLLKQAEGLKEDIRKLNITVEGLNGNVDKLNEKIGKLEKEITEKDKKKTLPKKPKK
jgi:peptidoglycan hydrolase CwlO-like protein